MSRHPDLSCKLASGSKKTICLNLFSGFPEDPTASAPSPTSHPCLTLLRVRLPLLTQASLWVAPVHSFYRTKQTLMSLRPHSQPTTAKAVPSASRSHHRIHRPRVTMPQTPSTPQPLKFTILSLPLPAFLPASSASA